MLISVLGFGRIWSTRSARNGKGPAHFNTTGVPASGKCRHRSCIYGYVRIDECTGFHPDRAHRWLSRVYESDPLTIFEGKRKLFLKKPLSSETTPEVYLVRIATDHLGWIDRQKRWICDQGDVVSFSEGNGQQEALVVLPAFGWITAGGASFHLNPDTVCPWRAALNCTNGELK
ncbi:MAG: hypothetical protein JOZ62_10030 [Acidobacteriaceae bacterium]|nr:hypothetical protein [Acidobacteriaceae bacterium]